MDIKQLKRGTAVRAATVRRPMYFRNGKVVRVDQGARGAWVRVKDADGAEFSTRSSLCNPA